MIYAAIEIETQEGIPAKAWYSEDEAKLKAHVIKYVNENCELDKDDDGNPVLLTDFDKDYTGLKSLNVNF